MRSGLPVESPMVEGVGSGRRRLASGPRAFPAPPGDSVSGLDRWQLSHLPEQKLRRAEKLLQQLFADRRRSAVLRPVPVVVALREKPDDRFVNFQGMNQGLEDDESTLRTVAVPAQGGEGEAVGGVVGEIEAAVGGVLRVGRVPEAVLGRANQALEFLQGWRLRPERSRADEALELRQPQARPRSRRAAPAGRCARRRSPSSPTPVATPPASRRSGSPAARGSLRPPAAPRRRRRRSARR